MTFGLHKCAKATFIRGKPKYTSSIVLDMDAKLRNWVTKERINTWV